MAAFKYFSDIKGETMSKFIDMIGYVPRVGLIGINHVGFVGMRHIFTLQDDAYGNLVPGNFAAACYFVEA